MRTHFFNIVLTLAILAATGCTKPETAPAPDPIPAQATQELFKALAASRTADVDKALRRVQDLNPQDTFPGQLRRQMHLRDGLAEINRLLAQGKLSAAQQILTKLEREIGATPELLGVRDTLGALNAIAACRRGEPYRTSVAAAAALAVVRTAEAPLKESPSYQAFMRQQEQALAKLARQEKLAEFQKQLLRYDAALVAGSPETGKILEALRTLGEGVPDLSPAAALVLEKQPSTEALAAWLIPSHWQEREMRPLLEVVFCREWARLSPEQRAKLAPLAIGPETPTTVCGKILLVRACLATGQEKRAREWAEHVARHYAVSPELAGEALTALALPPEALKPKAWTAPFPTVTDYLERLEQLRRNDPGK